MLGRRFPTKPPQLAPTLRPPSPGSPFPANVVLWTEEAFQALQRFLRDLHSSVEGGLPGGASTTPPSDVRAGVLGSVGNPSSGWASGSHRHPVSTTVASALIPLSVSTEGVSESLARADHTHDLQAVMADVLAKDYLRL